MNLKCQKALCNRATKKKKHCSVKLAWRVIDTFDVKLSDLIPHMKMRNLPSPNLTEVWQNLMNFCKVFTYHGAEGKKKKV